MTNERVCANNPSVAENLGQFETDAMNLLGFLEGLQILIDEGDRIDDVGRQARNAAQLMLTESIDRADKLMRELGKANLALGALGRAAAQAAA